MPSGRVSGTANANCRKKSRQNDMIALSSRLFIFDEIEKVVQESRGVTGGLWTCGGLYVRVTHCSPSGLLLWLPNKAEGQISPFYSPISTSTTRLLYRCCCRTDSHTNTAAVIDAALLHNPDAVRWHWPGRLFILPVQPNSPPARQQSFSCCS